MLRTSSHESRRWVKKLLISMRTELVLPLAWELNWRCLDQEEHTYESGAVIHNYRRAGRSSTSWFITYRGKPHIFFINLIFINFKQWMPSTEWWGGASMKCLSSGHCSLSVMKLANNLWRICIGSDSDSGTMRTECKCVRIIHMSSGIIASISARLACGKGLRVSMIDPTTRCSWLQNTALSSSACSKLAKRIWWYTMSIPDHPS
jgi:hypothetical protein